MQKSTEAIHFEIVAPEHRAVQFTKIHPEAKLPTRSTDGSVGFDMFSAYDGVIQPGKHALVSTGLNIALPAYLEAQVRPRSGLALKHKVTVLNSPGTVDPDYRGELGAILINHSDYTFHYKVGDRIAQLVFCPVVSVDLNLVETFTHPNTKRGDGGYGSTGR